MSNTSDFVDLLNKEIEELQKAIKEPIKCNETATEISREYARRVMLENQLFYKQGCLSKNYYYEHQISVLEKALEIAVKHFVNLEDCDFAKKSWATSIKYFKEQAQKELKQSE